jgi:hypothetical protein
MVILDGKWTDKLIPLLSFLNFTQRGRLFCSVEELDAFQ